MTQTRRLIIQKPVPIRIKERQPDFETMKLSPQPAPSFITPENEQLRGCLVACYYSSLDRNGKVRHFDSSTDIDQIFLRSTANSFIYTRDFLIKTSNIIAMATGGAAFGVFGLNGDLFQLDKECSNARYAFQLGTEITAYPLFKISTAASIFISLGIVGPATTTFFVPIKIYNYFFGSNKKST